MTEVRRQLGCDVQFAGSWETQMRGMLHRHVLLWVAPGVAVRRVKAAVRLAAYRNHFGRQLDCRPVTGSSAAEVIRYIAKYATKGGVLAVSLDVATGELKEGGYRRWSASRRWGQTMASVRAESFRWWQSQVAGRPGEPDGVGPLAGGPGGAEGVALDSDWGIYADLLRAGLDLVAV